MLYRKIKRLKNDGTLDGLVFFAQRMDELLFDYSLDTYKPSALNAPFLCIEAINIINDIEEKLIDANNLKYVMEELEWSIKNDYIAKSLLDADVDYYLLQNENVKMSDKKIRLEVLSRTLDPLRYLNKCFELLSKFIERKDKKDIECVTRTLVTSLINMGMSKTYLYQKTHEFFFSAAGTEISSVEQVRAYP